MDRPTPAVNRGAPRGQARTRVARRAVVGAAAALFTEHGYVATTIETISERSGVPAATVYRLFPGKIGILQAVLDTSIGGDDEDVAVQDRPALVAALKDPDAHTVIAGVVAVTTGIHERSNAAYHVLTAAAAADPAAARLLASLTDQRQRGQRLLTAALARRRALRPGLSEAAAADIVYALLAPEVYRLLVVDRGWRPARYRAWLTTNLQSQLLG